VEAEEEVLAVGVLATEDIVEVAAEEIVPAVEVSEEEVLEAVVVEAVLNLRQGEPHQVPAVAVAVDADLRVPAVAVVIPVAAVVTPVAAVVMDLEEGVLEAVAVEEVSR